MNIQTKRLTWRTRCNLCQRGVVYNERGEGDCGECDGHGSIAWPFIIFRANRFTDDLGWGPDQRPWCSVGLYLFGFNIITIQTGRSPEGEGWASKPCWIMGCQFRGPRYNHKRRKA